MESRITLCKLIFVNSVAKLDDNALVNKLLFSRAGYPSAKVWLPISITYWTNQTYWVFPPYLRTVLYTKREVWKRFTKKIAKLHLKFLHDCENYYIGECDLRFMSTAALANHSGPLWSEWSQNSLQWSGIVCCWFLSQIQPVWSCWTHLLVLCPAGGPWHRCRKILQVGGYDKVAYLCPLIRWNHTHFAFMIYWAEPLGWSNAEMNGKSIRTDFIATHSW